MRISRKPTQQTIVATGNPVVGIDSCRNWVLFGDPTISGSLSNIRPRTPGTHAGTMDRLAESGFGMDELDKPAGGAGTTAADGLAVAVAPEPPDIGGRLGSKKTADRTDATNPHRDPLVPVSFVDRIYDATARAGARLVIRLVNSYWATPRGRTVVVHRARRAAGHYPGLLAVVLVGLAWTSRAEAAYSYRMDVTIARSRIGTAGGSTTLTRRSATEIGARASASYPR